MGNLLTGNIGAHPFIQVQIMINLLKYMKVQYPILA